MAEMAVCDEYVVESPKDIPVAYDVDVVVAGGSSGAVAAACEAASRGATVFLAAPRPYLGTDLCATLRLWLDESEQPESKLAAACFGNDRIATPWVVKAAMDKALIEAGVSCLTGCYVTEVLRDRDGRIAGIVMANRSGRQAVRAKVVIDATPQAMVARQADVEFRPFLPGRHEFKRVVIGGEMQSGSSVSGEKKEFTVHPIAKNTDRRLPVYEYTLQIEVQDESDRSDFRVENLARDLTNGAGTELASEVLTCVPSDTIVADARLEDWPGAAHVDLAAFRPQGVPQLFVLSGYADLDSKAGEELMRPLELIELGRRIGRAAAEQAAQRPFPVDAMLAESDTSGGPSATIGEEPDAIRFRQREAIHAGRRALPVLGRYDVVVIGGGTSGAPAGIAAARSGAKTLVVEYLHELGGVGTVGLIAKYWYGVRRGYTAYVDEQVNPGRDFWNAAEKAEWLRRELIRSGAEVWFGVLGCGALVEDGRVRGVVVATPRGRGIVLASTVVDATGNSDIAACAGAETSYSLSERGSLNVQIAGFPERPLQRYYVNTCYTMVDDTDVVDVWHLMAWKRTARGTAPAFDVGQLVDSRERRRTVGDYTLTVPDLLNHRTWPDTICHHYSNFDAAAFPDSPLLLASDAKGPCFPTDLPYRCLLPKQLEGILVVGLGASVQRDAMTLTRMQADLQNQGYAAGVAAAAAARLDGRTRSVDIKAIQEQLVREDVLDARVLTDQDSYPMGAADITKAANAIGASDQNERLAALAVILAHAPQAIPLLQSRYRESSAENQRLVYASILGILGEPTGAPTLTAAVDARDRWDNGTALTSQRKTGNTFSDLDRLVIALGLSRVPEARPALIRKLQQLPPDGALSSYKAISLALWDCLGQEAIEPLVRLLDQPGFTGHATVEPVVERVDSGGRPIRLAADRLVTEDNNERANNSNLNQAFRELIVAAMLYRFGDPDGRAEVILNQYAQDIHGHFARYAQRVLDE